MQEKTPILPKIKKAFLIATITFLSLGALLSIMLILVGASDTQLRVIGTTLILGIFSSLIVSNISRIDNNSRLLQVLAWVSLVASLIATIILILMVWGAFNVHCPASNGYYTTTTYGYDRECYANWQIMTTIVSKVLWISIIVAFTAAIYGRFMSYNSDNALIAVFRVTTMICATFLGSLFIVCILIETLPEAEILWKIIVIAGILLVLGLIGTPILVAINKHRNQQIIDSATAANEQTLRAKIEQEVRAQIAAEEKAKAAAAEKSASEPKTTPKAPQE